MNKAQETKENWQKARKILGLLVLWIFMPITAFFEMQEVMTKKKEDAPDLETAPKKKV